MHTVLAWEHKLAASLLAQSRDFYRCHLHQLVTVKPDFFLVPKKSAIIRYRADATNERKWANEKLHVCEVSMPIWETEDVWECLWLNKRYAEMHVVGASCQSGQFQLKMFKKAIWICWSPTWSQLTTVCKDLFDTVSTPALRAARAYDVSSNPWNAVKVQRALTLLIDSISPLFSGPRNTTCCEEGLLCSSSERPLPSSIAC